MEKPETDIKLDDLVLKEELKEEPKEEVKEEVKVVVEEPIKVKRNKHLNYTSRGFATLEDAYAYIETDAFEHLGEADKQEYITWLNK